MYWRDVEITFENKASLFDLGLRSAFHHLLTLCGTELISGKLQGSISVISGLPEAGNATTGEQKAYCYFTAVVYSRAEKIEWVM